MQQDDVRRALKADGYDDEAVDRFLAYHALNPDAWRLFEQAALRILSAGTRRIGAKAIGEDLRRNVALQKGARFKLNNSFISLYARVFCFKYPATRSRFEFRHVQGLSERQQQTAFFFSAMRSGGA